METGAGRIFVPGRSSDEELIERCLAGDQDAWRDLILRYRRLMYSIPVSYRGIDADEVFQAVAVKLFENLKKLRRHESLAAWIATTTRRECIAARRKARKLVSIEDRSPEDTGEEPPDFALRVFEIECEHMLLRAIELLDEVCRTLLTALYVEEPKPSYKEVAERIGRPIGSLGPTRGRCLGKLREHYLDLGGEIPRGVSTDPQPPPQG